MPHFSRMLVGAVVVAVAILPVAGSASAAPTNSAQMSPMGELGCC